MWSEGDNYDLALSFQEKAGCDEIWEKICQVTENHSLSLISVAGVVFKTCSSNLSTIRLFSCNPTLLQVNLLCLMINKSMGIRSSYEIIKMSLALANAVLSLSASATTYVCNFFCLLISIRQIQGKDPSVTITQDIPEDDDSEERFEEVLDSTGPIELPACELSKLDEIAELFNSVLPSPIRREKLALAIEQDNYIRKLLDLFHICEDLENLEGLHHLYDIFKSLFFMNKQSLLEIMLADDLVFDVVGCLEYDPSKPTAQRHRLFLKESANFKEIIPITNSDIINKIHQTYRVQYIYDAILPQPSVFDDNMLSAMNSFILFNRIEIATHLQVRNVSH